ncbi:hypothetical protein [Parachitinimonas caeni]|uniref:Uncharacterized protein n=1 Tax=Parachitinimonas caeni TaxID=3031301 RepID=A0ABT7E4G4_9NEIS|nr:hypothetical protein [Parachitinimonas caeni]MDK2126954.1 hypothetical protein [Parachitinimonas caeni]
MKSVFQFMSLLGLLALSVVVYGDEGPYIPPAPVEFGDMMRHVDAIIDGKIVSMHRQYINLHNGKLFGDKTDLTEMDCVDRVFDSKIEESYADGLIVVLTNAKIFHRSKNTRNNPERSKLIQLRLFHDSPCKVASSFRKLLKSERWLFLSPSAVTTNREGYGLTYAYLKKSHKSYAWPGYPNDWRFEPSFLSFADGVQPVSLLDVLIKKLKEAQ